MSVYKIIGFCKYFSYMYALNWTFTRYFDTIVKILSGGREEWLMNNLKISVLAATERLS